MPGNQAAIFGENSKPNCTPLCQRIEKKCKFKVKLNDYWTNFIKIKSNDIIKFLIGQFDLIMGQIKF
jgi:hypothetical protein